MCFIALLEHDRDDVRALHQGGHRRVFLGHAEGGQTRVQAELAMGKMT
jgi:hypothetical protein